MDRQPPKYTLAQVGDQVFVFDPEVALYICPVCDSAAYWPQVPGWRLTCLECGAECQVCADDAEKVR